MASARKLAYTNYFMTVGLLWFNAMLHCRMIALADFKNIYTVEKIRVVSVKNNAECMKSSIRVITLKCLSNF